MYLLDTNMVSYIVKGRSLAASDRLVALPSSDVAAVSAVTVGEINYGLVKIPEAIALRSLMERFSPASGCSVGVQRKRMRTLQSKRCWRSRALPWGTWIC